MEESRMPEEKRPDSKIKKSISEIGHDVVRMSPPISSLE
jgi:hypothetical protein